MFDYYNNILCVQGGWLYEGITYEEKLSGMEPKAGVMTKCIYRNLKNRNWLKTARRGCKGTPALIEYDSVPERFKKLIVEKYGDPYKTTKNTGFKDYLERDEKAEKFFNDYTFDNNRALPDENKAEYIANATVLNAIYTVLNDRTAKRRVLGGRTTKIWESIATVIQELPKHTYPHSLPTNVRRLKEKLRNYRKNSYISLIHKGFCNKNSEKINNDAQMWLLSRWADRINKVANIKQLLHEYNSKAETEAWKKLEDEKAIFNFLNHKEIKPLWYGHRYGELKAKEKYTYHHSTKLPSMRDSLWYSDGTKLNYFYLDEDGKIATCQVYEVMDAYSEVFLGYHISKTEDSEQLTFTDLR